MTEHLKAEKLEAILEGLRDGAVRRVLVHVTECSGCRRLLQAALTKRDAGPRMLTSRILPFGRGEAAGTAGPGHGPGHGSGGENQPEAWLEVWLARVKMCARREQATVVASVDELVAQPPARRRVLVHNNPRFRSWALAARLLEASREAGYEDLEEAEDLARLAMEVTRELDPAVYGERLILDLEARAWGQIGNVLRQQSRGAEAEEAFERGLEKLQGTADPLEWARHLALKASLLRHQLRHEEALETVREATALYREAGQRERIPAMQALEATIQTERGAPEEALPPLEEARRAIDAARDPRLAWVVSHNLATTLVEMGRHVEAHRVYSRAQPLYDRFQDRYSVLRRRWLESLLAAGSGDGDRAVELFLEVRNGYVEAGLELEAATVSMDLARLWASQGRWAQLRRLATEMAPIFASKNFQPQVLMALAFFRQAVEQETITAGIVREVGTFLRRSRNDPSLVFRPPAPH